MSGDQIVYKQKKEFGECFVNGKCRAPAENKHMQAQCKQSVIAERKMHYQYLLGRHCAFVFILYIYHVCYHLYTHVQVQVSPDG